MPNIVTSLKGFAQNQQVSFMIFEYTYVDCKRPYGVTSFDVDIKEMFVTSKMCEQITNCTGTVKARNTPVQHEQTLKLFVCRELT